MTLRSRQGPNRSRSWSDPERRTFLTNLAFTLTVIFALLLLVIAAGAAYYDGHLAPAIKVNNQSLSKDDLAKQMAVDSYILDYQTQRTRTLLTEGHLWSTDATNRITALQNAAASLESNAASELTDGLIQLDLAAKQGIPVTNADIDARLTALAQVPELRHVYMISVIPTLKAGQTVPTAAQKAAALATAQQALTALKGGGDWAKIAKTFSNDVASGNGGDIGFIDKNSSLDPVFTNAMMAATPNTISDPIEGLDGGYRIGKVTEILPATAGPSITDGAKAAGVDLNALRTAISYEAASKKLSDSIVNAALAVGPQRHYAEIYMQASASESGPGAIRVRHILYSPNHDPTNASTLAATDPAWAAAKALADATYAKLLKDPTQFDAIARAESDESGDADTGGKLPYFSTTDQIDAGFAAAIFKPGLTPGELLPPVKSAFGWHVIQVMHGPTDLAWAAKLVAQATSADVFATLARDNSDKPQAASGGDMGWTSQGQLPDAVGGALFGAPIGKVSQPIVIPGDGTYIFWVYAAENRAPDPIQTANIQASAFSNWYSAQKGAYTTWEDPAISAAAAG